MANRAVHWEEGMFLTPQHFQAADRHARHALAELEEWHHPFPWGYRSLTLDEKALAAGQLILKACRARLPDGTHVTVGEGDDADAPRLSIDLNRALTSADRLVVFLAVPTFSLGLPNAEPEPLRAPGAAGRPRPRPAGRADPDDDGPHDEAPGDDPDPFPADEAAEDDGEGPRFLVVDEPDCVDENTGRNPKPLRFRRIRACLRTSADDLTGYACLPLAGVQRGAEKGSQPVVVGKVVPPLLALDAWPWLRDLVAEVAVEVRGRLRQLADLAVDRELSFRGQDPGDAERLLKLFALNEVEPPLSLLARTPGVSPLAAYLELCRAAGRLGIFLRARRPPRLPAYDHNNAGACFAKVAEVIRQALEGAEPVRAVAVPLARAGRQLQASLQEGWADPRRLFLAVESELTPEECDALLKDETVDRTIGAAAQVEELYNRRSRGLSLTPVSRPDGLPPRSTTPHLPHIAYFRFDASESRLWQGVVHDRSLAIRFNVKDSPFLSDEEVQVQARAGDRQPARAVRLRFVLHVMPER